VGARTGWSQPYLGGVTREGALECGELTWHGYGSVDRAVMKEGVAAVLRPESGVDEDQTVAGLDEEHVAHHLSATERV
jgi:hypothetical protein